MGHSGPRKIHKHKGIVSGKGVWRSTGGSRPQGHREGPILVGKAGRRADFEAIPMTIRQKSGPEARCPARKHYCVTFYPGHL